MTTSRAVEANSSAKDFLSGTREGCIKKLSPKLALQKLHSLLRAWRTVYSSHTGSHLVRAAAYCRLRIVRACGEKVTIPALGDRFAGPEAGKVAFNFFSISSPPKSLREINLYSM